MRRTLAALATTPLLLAATACGGGGFEEDGDKQLTVVSQGFAEAQIMAELYGQLLDEAGYDVELKSFESRDIYLPALEKGEVQVSADYLSSMTEALNRRANGEDAEQVASPDTDATLEQLKTLGEKYGVEPLAPAEAQDSNAYAVTTRFAEANGLSTLSDLGAKGTPVALAANEDCPQRQDCQKGLESVYRIKVSKVVPLGFGSQQTKDAAKSGEVQLAQVGSTDGTLESLGLVILEDDKSLQNAENLVPIVNSEWLADNDAAQEALDKLAPVLTTGALTEMIGQVDVERAKPEDVAERFLEAEGLVAG